MEWMTYSGPDLPGHECVLSIRAAGTLSHVIF